MDVIMQPWTEHKKRINVTSLGTGELARSAIEVRSSSAKSLAIGTLRSKEDGGPSIDLSSSRDLTASLSKEYSLSVGSTASADSFVPVLDSSSSQHSSEYSNDPYLESRRQRPVKQEPEIPRCEVECAEESVNARTRFSSLVAASLPSTLQVPAVRFFTREEGGSVFNFVTNERKAKETMPNKAQIYWKTVVATRLSSHGAIHHKTAQAYYSLGQACLNSGDYLEAANSFKSACRIWKELEGPSHLSVGLGLDSYGLAMLRLKKTTSVLLQAKSALDEAFAIRFHHLGVWHVDTVETYNKIASVHLHLGNYKDACSAYEEVFLVRKAIFGMNHASVAISAHALANVHLKMSRPNEARRYYNIALDVYNRMGVPHDHPTVAKLLRHRAHVQRVGMSEKRRK